MLITVNKRFVKLSKNSMYDTQIIDRHRVADFIMSRNFNESKLLCGEMYSYQESAHASLCTIYLVPANSLKINGFGKHIREKMTKHDCTCLEFFVCNVLLFE